jgi:hypothetical protein
LRQLGLLVLAVLFHEQPARAHVDLAQGVSDITEFIVDYEYLDESYPGYQSHPYRYSYYPHDTERHPWWLTPGGVQADDLPCFLLEARDQHAGDHAWASRDLVRLCGSDLALARLAALLLDAGRPENPVVQYDLEDEGGFRGVGIHSAEAFFVLPGSLAWDDRLL